MRGKFKDVGFDKVRRLLITLEHLFNFATEFAKESGMAMDTDGDGFFDKMKTYFE